jgi:hypothetical protein
MVTSASAVLHNCDPRLHDWQKSTNIAQADTPLDDVDPIEKVRESVRIIPHEGCYCARVHRVEHQHRTYHLALRRQQWSAKNATTSIVRAPNVYPVRFAGLQTPRCAAFSVPTSKNDLHARLSYRGISLSLVSLNHYVLVEKACADMPIAEDVE